MDKTKKLTDFSEGELHEVIMFDIMPSLGRDSLLSLVQYAVELLRQEQQTAKARLTGWGTAARTVRGGRAEK